MSSAMLIDLSKCIGCRGCQVACKAWNDLPGEVTLCLGCYDNPPDLSPSTWNRIAFYEKERDDGQVAWMFRPIRCLHCTEASCVEVCPTGAAAHRGEFVVFDQKWCIGCGYCETACPFDVPRLGEGAEKGSATKCWFCADRVSDGLKPACAAACPTGAIEFGDRNALIAKANDRVGLLKGQGLSDAILYGDKLLGGLGQMYLLQEKPSFYGLPEAPRVATRTAVGSWVSGLVTAGIVAAVPFWLLFRRKEALAAEEASVEEAAAEEVSEGGE